MTSPNARRDFTVALFACTLVSLAGNEASSTMLARDLGLPIPVVMVAGAIAPLLLPAAVHLVPKTAGLPQKARRVVIFAVLVSATAAFALSFASLTAVAQASGHPGRLGMLLPIAVDVLAAAAAYALVVMPADAPVAEQPVEQSVEQLPVHHVNDAPALEYPATLTRLAPVHRIAETAPEQAVHQPTDGAPAPASGTSAPAVTSDDEAMHHPAAPVHQESETQPVHTAERHLVAVHRGEAPAQSQAVQAQSQPVRQRTAPEPEQAPEVQPVHLEQAAAVVQAGASELPVPRIAEVFARKDRGESQNTIAKAVPVNKRTVSKVLAAREELGTTAEEPEPAFA
ncbi:DUF2637 domain-containing protein [Mycolicibacterium fortuitum]|uniref:DUF2637 domain-containing protein n=1 Tax=Mycolicibacterium fortuitum TaxID=1766 RepID=UPI0007E95A18|nr:DUF2637 domain-containing protein [Mycolicibacterium fortuitum]OBB53116.1 hypothetical protein A5754_21545 [Mycolicibacterium fortuitum]OBB74852.1 hypothetical protein A5755_14290 [Mycolicibacterium fortuitum]OBF66699.1 hypothetical protein A5751_02130 [Mycolicibacterium fortuitum]